MDNNDKKLNKEDFKWIRIAVRHYDDYLATNYWQHRQACSYDMATSTDKERLDLEYEQLTTIDNLLSKLEL